MPESVHLADNIQYAVEIPLKGGNCEIGYAFAVHNAQNVQDALHRDRPGDTGGYLVQQTQCIAHAAAGLPGNELQLQPRDIDPLIPADSRHVIRYFVGVHAFQIMTLTPGKNGHGNFLRFSGGH